jgi:hypothetical protein
MNCVTAKVDTWTNLVSYFILPHKKQKVNADLYPMNPMEYKTSYTLNEK